MFAVQRGIVELQRPPLGSSGGDYCLNLSSVLRVTSWSWYYVSSPRADRLTSLICHHGKRSLFCSRTSLNVTPCQRLLSVGHQSRILFWTDVLREGWPSVTDCRSDVGSRSELEESSGSHRALTEPLLEANLPPWHTNCWSFTVPSLSLSAIGQCKPF